MTWLAFALVGLVTIILLVLALAQTGFGKAFIERQLARALAAPDGAPAEVEGLRGFLPFDIGLARLSLADAQGVWLRLEDLRLDWAPSALLRGRLHVEALTARRLEVARLPAAEEEAAEAEPAQPLNLPELPETVPPLTVDRLAVDRIVLAEAVLGAPATFGLRGGLVTREEGQSILLDLALARHDEATAEATLEARLELDAPALDLAFSAEETGGLLAAATGLPEAGDLSVSLNGSGPLTGWTGRLKVDAAGLGRADGTLRLAALEQPTIGLSAEVRPQPALVPDELQGPLGETIEIALEAVQTAPRALALERLRVVTAAMELTGEGRLDLEDDTLAADAALNVPDLAVLSGFAGAPLEGDARLFLRARGAPMQPHAQLRLEAGHLSAADARLARLETRLDLAFLRSLASGDLAFEATGEGSAEGLELAAVPELPIRDLSWRLDVGAPADGPIRISTLELTGGDVMLAAHGALDRTTLAGDLDVSLQASDLAALSAPFGQRVEGELSLASDVSIAEQAERIGVQLSGALSDLDGLPAGAAELLGPSVTLAANAELVPGERASVRDLVVEGASSRLSGEFALGLDDQVLRISDLALEGPGTRVDGNAVVNLDPLLIDGTLQGGVSDLAALEPLTGMALRGRIDLDARLSHEQHSQQVALRLEGSGLRAPFGQLETVQAQATVQDALAEPQIEAEVSLADLQQDDLRLERARIEASGTPAAWTIGASAAGRAVEPFSLETEAEIALADAVRVRLTRLTGSAADQPIRLAGPATLVLGDDTLALEQLDLRAAGATITADASLAGGQVEASGALRNLSLALLGRFGAPDLSGQADLTLQLAGPADDPQGTLDLSLRDLRSADPELADVPPIQLAATARLEERRLSTDLRAEGLTDAPVSAELALPVMLSLDPFAFETPSDGALSGRFDGQVQLARIDDLVDLGDQSLEGTFTADLAIAGTVGQPALDGALAIEGGRYAHGTTGTVVREITLQADVSEEALIISEFSATDGGDGRLSAEGRLAIEPANAFPFDLRARLEEATLVRREDVEAAASAQLELTGNTERARLGGTVTIERLEASIPEGTGPSVATLDVVEVGGSAPPASEQEAENGAGNGFELGLDLVIELPARVFVRGRGLESEWQGTLQVQGSATEPELTGQLGIRRGYFDFLDERFELRQGTIEFTGATPPAPEINLEAVAEGDEITAIVRLTGPATQPDLELTSEPVLPQDEVLSRLLFDQPLGEITPTQAAQLALAVNRLRGGGPGVLGRARDVLGVDTLEVGGGDEAGGASVRAGKYLSDEVYLEVEQGTAARSGKARVEIEVLPNVSLEAETGEDAGSGVGIQWKYDY